VQGEPNIFNQPCGNLRACLGVDRVPFKVFTFQKKEVVVVVDVLISVVPISELHIDYDQFENEATPYITPTATSESSFFLVSVAFILDFVTFSLSRHMRKY
jgi:hypothetical protein